MLKFKEVVERFDKQSDIAEELGMPTSVVSEWVQKLKERSDFMTSITTGTIRFITNTTGRKLKLLKITSIKLLRELWMSKQKGVCLQLTCSGKNLNLKSRTWELIITSV